MVPLRLSLRNFMCYRALEAPLELAGLHLACLSGANGAGKSALLDAMTWALWGQARSRSDDDLITSGEAEMEVDLEFGLAGQRYRVLRKRSRAGIRRAGQTVLELQVVDAEEAFRPITGNTARETQQLIQRLLRMDYQTFINSALLLQGRSDEFTLKAPGERKRVLSEILGLSRYDEYEAIAREKARTLQVDLAGLQAELRAMEAEASRRGELEAERDARAAEAQRAEDLAASAELSLAALQEGQRLRAEREQRLLEARARAAEAEGELKEQETRAGLLRDRLEGYKKVLERSEAVERSWDEYQRATEANERLQGAVQEMLALQQERARLERVLQDARGELNARVAVMQRDADRLRQAVARRTEYDGALRAARQALAAVPPLGDELAGHRARLEAIAGRAGVLQHTNEEIVRQGRELRAKVDQLGVPGAAGVCPLCGTELGPDGHKRIVEEYNRDLTRQRELYRENERELKGLQEEQAQRAAAVETLEQKIARERAAAQGQADGAEERLREVEQAAKDLEGLLPSLEEAAAALAAGAFAPDAAAALDEVNGRIRALDYDQGAHEALRRRIQELEPVRAAVQQLEEARRRVPEEEAALAATLEAAGRWRTRAEEERARSGALAAELAALPDRTSELAEAARELERRREHLAATRTDLGRVQAALERCLQVEAMLHDRRRDLAAQVEEKAVYDELAVAFGRRGVQALLIDAALPELEDEANALLSRMTDNRMHIRLNTQRQARSGATVETLDIQIGDELGTRPYELYSGGEAFRINFALRIAISKILARRAGAPLPTLILDEGFGTQDAAGREKLVEAVNAIASDFELILVITHIEELKDEFPVRIEVTKTPAGSRAEVV